MASNVERSAAWPVAIALVISGSPRVTLVRVVTTIDYDLEGSTRVD